MKRKTAFALACLDRQRADVLKIVALVAATTSFAATAHAGPTVKPMSGAVKALSPQPLPPGGGVKAPVSR